MTKQDKPTRCESMGPRTGVDGDGELTLEAVRCERDVHDDGQHRADGVEWSSTSPVEG